jgi:predicted PurR-regulated permease PerM
VHHTSDREGFGTPGRSLRATPFLFGLFAAAGALVTLVAFVGVRRVGVVLMMLVAAGYFAVGLDRPVAAMVQRGLGRGTAVLIVVAAGLLLVCAVIGAGIPALMRQVDSFVADLPALLDKLEARTGVSPGITGEVADRLTPSDVAKLAVGLLSGASTLSGALFIGITTVMLTLFVLAGLDRLREGAYRLVVASRRDRVRAIAGAVEEKVGAYLVGAVGIAVIAGAAAFLWSFIVGVPYPLLMALVVALFDLIPQIGATIGSTVVILVALTQSWGVAVATLGFFCCYQGLENWVVYPRVMSRAVNISALAAIVAAMVGWSLLGVLGVLLAVPAYASVRLIVREVVFPRQDAR